MVPFEKKERFRINPVEVAIFAVISLVFVKSGYSLLNSRGAFSPQVLTASAQDPLAPAGSLPGSTDGRTPASFGPTTPVTKAFSELNIDCDPSQREAAVSANKIRLIGHVCGGAVVKINVVNTSAKITATVFPDYSNSRFSTDYISLDQGKNLITVEYQFKDGKVLGQQFAVTKN